MKNNANNVFPDHFREFIEALNTHEVEYLLIGGYAVGAYGYIRGTGDLDIFLNSTEENAEKAIAACIEYGIPKKNLTKEMFIIPKMIGIGEPPMRIEILKKLDTVDFQYTFQRVVKTVVDGVPINVISLDDLIVLKKAAVKGRDTEDLNYLLKLKTKK